MIFDYTGVITVPLSMGGGSGAPANGEPNAPSEAAVQAQRLREMMAEEINNPDPEGLWNRLERGETPLVDLIDRIEAIAPGLGVFFSGDGPTSIMASMTVRPDVIERIRQWKSEGILLALLTNNVAEWRAQWTTNLTNARGYELFDVIIDSSAVGMRKPEARIYTHTVRALSEACNRNLTVEDCVFIDDFAQNVRGAEEVGIRSFLATTDDAHWAALDELLNL
jgi:putative hydrolase of the HAD superfamily